MYSNQSQIKKLVDELKKSLDKDVDLRPPERSSKKANKKWKGQSAKSNSNKGKFLLKMNCEGSKDVKKPAKKRGGKTSAKPIKSKIGSDTDGFNSDELTLSILQRKAKKCKKSDASANISKMELEPTCSSSQEDVKIKVEGRTKLAEKPLCDKGSKGKKVKVETRNADEESMSASEKKILENIMKKRSKETESDTDENLEFQKPLAKKLAKNIEMKNTHKIKRMRVESGQSDSEQRARRLRLFGFWNGPERHRVASLNALAKLHCIYEDESKGVMAGIEKIGEIPKRDGKSEKKTAKKKDRRMTPGYTKTEPEESGTENLDSIVINNRTLRGAPRTRGAGKHWDMFAAGLTTSTSRASSDESHSDSDAYKRRPLPLLPGYHQKMQKKERNGKQDILKIPKRRRKADIGKDLDLKDMVVGKRMASLIASAILAASCSSEKRSTRKESSGTSTEDGFSSPDDGTIDDRYLSTDDSDNGNGMKSCSGKCFDSNGVTAKDKHGDGVKAKAARENNLKRERFRKEGKEPSSKKIAKRMAKEDEIRNVSIEKMSDSDTGDEYEYKSDSDNGQRKLIKLRNTGGSNNKVAVIVNQDTDATIKGVYLNSTRSTHQEGFCSTAGIQYRISSTSHTQIEATAVLKTRTASKQDFCYSPAYPPSSNLTPVVYSRLLQSAPVGVEIIEETRSLGLSRFQSCIRSLFSLLIARKNLPLTEQTYQSCPCPMQSCPENVHMKPLTGECKRRGSMPPPPVVLQLPGAAGPYSPARGSVGTPPLPIPIGNYARPNCGPSWDGRVAKSTALEPCSDVNWDETKARLDAKSKCKSEVLYSESNGTWNPTNVKVSNTTRRSRKAETADNKWEVMNREGKNPPPAESGFPQKQGLLAIGSSDSSQILAWSEQQVPNEETATVKAESENVTVEGSESGKKKGGEERKRKSPGEEVRKSRKRKRSAEVERTARRGCDNAFRRVKRKSESFDESAGGRVRNAKKKIGASNKDESVVENAVGIKRKSQKNALHPKPKLLKDRNKTLPCDTVSEVIEQVNRGQTWRKKRRPEEVGVNGDKIPTRRSSNQEKWMVPIAESHSSRKSRSCSPKGLARDRNMSMSGSPWRSARENLKLRSAKNGKNRAEAKPRERNGGQEHSSTSKSMMTNSGASVVLKAKNGVSILGKSPQGVGCLPSGSESRRDKCEGSAVATSREFSEVKMLSASPRSNMSPKSSNGWSWDGHSFNAKVYLSNNEAPVMRKCYSAMRHVGGDVIRPQDCILLKAGPRKIDLPFVAKVAALWENPDDGEMMVSLLWYYRPEHTKQGRQSSDGQDELFASRHKDISSVACIKDKCFVLTFNEYCWYRKKLKCIEEGIVERNLYVPLPEQPYPRLHPQSPCVMAPDMVFFSRRVYDFRQKRLLKIRK